MKLAAVIAVALLSTRAFADEPPQEAELRQIGEADLVAFGIGAVALATCVNACHSFQPATFGIGMAALGVFAVGPSIAFLRQDEPVRAALSVALRVGVPLATLYAAEAWSNAATCDPYGPDTGFPCGYGRYFAATILGATATLMAPYLVAVVHRPVAPIVGPRSVGFATQF